MIKLTTYYHRKSYIAHKYVNAKKEKLKTKWQTAIRKSKWITPAAFSFYHHYLRWSRDRFADTWAMYCVCQEVSGTSFAFRWSVWDRQNLQERPPVTREGNTPFCFFSFFSQGAFLTFLPQRQLLWGWAVWSDTGRGGCSSVPSRWHISELRVESHLWNGPSTHMDSPCRCTTLKHTWLLCE